MALLNSSIVDFYFRNHSVPFRGDYFSANRQYIEDLPIEMAGDPPGQQGVVREQVVRLVDQMLDLNQQLAAAHTAHDKTTIQRQIDATDRQIDRLVYDLYGLTDDEIAIVEQSTPAATAR
ncbi:MAG TPA: hypothetical protein VII06_04505 [Chloroflexota bacterium]|jgi:hypothetical protein